MLIVGLDLGTTRCKAARIDETGRPQIIHNRRGDPFTPSAIFFEDGCRPIVGVEALAEGVLQPEHVHSCFKRRLGSPDVLYTDADGKKYTATDFQSLMIASFKHDIETQLGETLDEAVITVPANFQDHKKQATLDAAQAAGIKVMKLVHEPTAAGIAYAMHKKQDMRFLVFDLGGGTFDVSIVDKRGDSISVLYTVGREHLGGADFAVRIERSAVAQFTKENGFQPDAKVDALFFSELIEKAEQAKVSLSEKSTTRFVLGCRGQQSIIEISREEFEEQTKDLLSDALECTAAAVKDAGFTWKDLDSLLLVGGAVRMPAVTSALADLTGIVPHCDIDPDRAVCYGAALQCAMELARVGKTLTIGSRVIPAPRAFVQDVTAYDVGCATLNLDHVLVNSVIIPKGTAIPTTRTNQFKLEHEHQTEARVEILQGEDGQAREECLSIGEIVLTNLPPERVRSSRIEVTYSVDVNAMIRARARDLVSGQEREIRIDYRKGTEQSSQSTAA